MITCSGIHKSFGSLEVIRGVDLSVGTSEVTAIVGSSGAGKTTLLQILGTLDRPGAGTVRYGDVDPFALRPAALARFRNSNIGFVFQFHQLLPEFTLLENVAMPALIGGIARREAFARASELVAMLGLKGHSQPVLNYWPFHTQAWIIEILSPIPSTDVVTHQLSREPK